MRDNLRTPPPGEPGNESNVSMLLTQSFFLGIFFGSLDIIAYSLFLSAFDEKMMAHGFLISGILSMAIMYLYSKIKFSYGYCLIFCTSVTLLIWGILAFFPGNGSYMFCLLLQGPLTLFHSTML